MQRCKREGPVNITSSLTGIVLVWILTHCLPGKQHTRECTPHAVDDPVCLRCPFCAYDEDVWVAARKQKIPASELQLMAQLKRAGLDMLARWQVKLGFWAAPVDFLLRLSRLVVLQADGSCHFGGLYEGSAAEKLADDLRFCVQAVMAGVSVVRVHLLQVNSKSYPTYLQAAVSEAASKLCVVLTPGYSTVGWYNNGKWLTYAEELAIMLPGFRVCTAAQNNIVICKL